MQGNWADIAILAIIAISTLISILRGFLREVLSLLAWIVAFWAAFTFTPRAAPLLEPYVEVPSIRFILGFAALFVLTLMLMSLFGYLLVKLIGRTGLTGTDRMLGLLFGLARGGVIVLLLVLLAGLTNLPQDPWWRQSQFLKHFERAALWVAGFMPDSVAQHIRFEPVQDTAKAEVN
jgi:membrane protein required for colicin V production